MKGNLLQVTISAWIGASIIGGCSQNASAAEDANKAIQALPPEKRFERIKGDNALSLPMKERAIENLPVTEDQKEKWKRELNGTG